MADKIVERIEGEAYDDFVRNFRLDRSYCSHAIVECPVCGYREWQSSGNNERVILIFERDLYWRPCHICTEVRTRNPEVSHWVLGVVSKLRKDLERKNGQGE